jgi:hypothetical protein
MRLLSKPNGATFARSDFRVVLKGLSVKSKYKESIMKTIYFVASLYIRIWLLHLYVYF